MSKPDRGTEGTHLSFSPAHDSRNGPNHVDGQRWVDGDLDKGYGQEEPHTQHVGQSDGYGKVEADIQVDHPDSTPIGSDAWREKMAEQGINVGGYSRGGGRGRRRGRR